MEKHKTKFKYRAVLSGELVYRTYLTDEEARNELRRLAYERYARLTDIQKLIVVKERKFWSRIIF